jgi:small subunit ribosomal protein S5
MTAKTSSPDRQQRRDRGNREPKEFAETTLSLDRVTRVVKGGRRMRSRAVVVVGNRKGKVGLGTGKANEVMIAVQKATKDAKRRMIRIPLVKGSIPHEVSTKHKSAKILLLPASEGTGVIAGGALRVILEHAGVKNVLSKRFGTKNKLVNAQATIKVLKTLRLSARPGQPEVIAEEPTAAEASAAKDKPQVTEMTRAEAKAQNEINRRANADDTPKEATK